MRRRFGKISLTSMPLCPHRSELEGRGEGRAGLRSVGRLPVEEASRRILSREGLGSKVSTCEGPPFMKKWMDPPRPRREVRRARDKRVLDLGGAGRR
jgi:hypothetical protein